MALTVEQCTRKEFKIIQYIGGFPDLNDLPDEVIHNIYNFLPFHSRQCCQANVCTKNKWTLRNVGYYTAAKKFYTFILGKSKYWVEDFKFYANNVPFDEWSLSKLNYNKVELVFCNSLKLKDVMTMVKTGVPEILISIEPDDYDVDTVTILPEILELPAKWIKGELHHDFETLHIEIDCEFNVDVIYHNIIEQQLDDFGTLEYPGELIQMMKFLNKERNKAAALSVTTEAVKFQVFAILDDYALPEKIIMFIIIFLLFLLFTFAW
ncbi:unnamed protein product [Caenorhabditis bovis]|uniref:F-box domain-containing protein n=1 Tax=Caenorhabditis bovis TaxID=2654633 RepID=A0A8S1EHX9_9PELO|nr:unnamed protein product [Caenorhabditis bovis]